MPQKYNRAGKMQNYVPAGQGDKSGEYTSGTSENSSNAGIPDQKQFLRASRFETFKKNNPKISDEEMQKRKELDAEGHYIVKGVDGSSAYFDNILEDSRDTSKKASPEAQKKYDEIRKRTPQITQDLRDAGFNLILTEYANKAGHSLYDKIQRVKGDELTKGVNLNDVEAMDRITDVVRYTHMGKHKDLANITKKAIDELNAHPDYEVVEVDNKYLYNKSYKAIHLKIKDKKTDVVFEIQIHSPEEQEIKNKTHDLYKKSQDPSTPPEEAQRLIKQSEEMWANLPLPDGIEDIKNYEKEN